MVVFWSFVLFLAAGTVFAEDGNTDAVTIEHLGCFADKRAPERDLNLYGIGSRSMTIDTCAEHCNEKGTDYFGVQFGLQCWCGDSYGKHGEKPANDCNMKCGGDDSQTCGGRWAQNVYSLRGTDYLETFPSLHENRGCVDVSDIQQYFDTDALSDEHLSLDQCRQYCQGKGSSFMTVVDSTNCHCFATQPGADIATKDMVPCNVVCHGYVEPGPKYPSASRAFQTACGTRGSALMFQLVDNTYGIQYVGCYGKFTSLFRKQYEIESLSCMRSCVRFGYQYTATRLGEYCYCGNQESVQDQHTVPEEECDTPCTGDPDQTCGGRRAYSVYNVKQVT